VGRIDDSERDLDMHADLGVDSRCHLLLHARSGGLKGGQKRRADCIAWSRVQENVWGRRGNISVCAWRGGGSNEQRAIEPYEHGSLVSGFLEQRTSRTKHRTRP
jgi:hypothetical protein